MFNRSQDSAVLVIYQNVFLNTLRLRVIVSVRVATVGNGRSYSEEYKNPVLFITLCGNLKLLSFVFCLFTKIRIL